VPYEAPLSFTLGRLADPQRWRLIFNWSLRPHTTTAWKSLLIRKVCCTIVCVYAPPASGSDRYPGDSDAIGRHADRDHIGLGLMPRHKKWLNGLLSHSPWKS
jgi:hypothetical protein